MAGAQTSPPPFTKSRSRLLSLDEVPHKRHVPAPVLCRENPLVPEPGTPAFAERKDQYAANTVAELRQEQETKRQQRKDYLNQRRQCQGAAAYQSQREEARKFERESERVLNLQSSDAGKSNRSGDHFDIVNLSYQSSQGGRQLKLMDETVKYKAALRTMDIFSKHHSVQHDIITGHPLVANYIMPSKPVIP
ncbi:hypothetical protein WJX79_006352 [Trebouxia sp. C0005]|nr:MAG: hypothetical protein FRX49_05570 [Trebouxia sp. A1-2]